MPSDVAPYLRYIYGHRVNPAVLQIGSEQMQEFFDAIEAEVASLKRGLFR